MYDLVLQKERKMNNTCLMVMQAREIPEVLDALSKLERIDVAYFKGYTEKQLEKPINAFIESTNYEYYMLVSDDVVVNQNTIDLLKRYAEPNIAIGAWSLFNYRLSNTATDIRLRKVILHHFIFPLGVTLRQIMPQPIQNVWFSIKIRTFCSVKDIQRQENEVFDAYWVGYTPYCLSRKLWLKYPFTVYHSRFKHIPEEASDIVLNERLHRDHIPIRCVKSAYSVHLATKENWIVGKVKPSVRLLVC